MRLLAVVLLLVSPALVSAADRKEGPKEGKTTKDILKGIEPIKGFGVFQTAHFERRDRQVFVVWYCPTSGEATCRVHAYFYDVARECWSKLTDQFFHGTHDISVELAPRKGLVFRDLDGKVIFREEDLAKPQDPTKKE
jgi:hypothetical protein